MRGRPEAAREAPIQVWMELDLESNPIRGTIRGADGTPSVFTGWLGLTAALDALRVGTGPPEIPDQA